jgi:hypothetical protein
MTVENITHKVPTWCKRYITVAAAKLDIPKSQVVVDALKMHHDFMVRTGIIEKDQ